MSEDETLETDREIRLARPEDSTAVRSCVRAAYAQYVSWIGREPAPMSADYIELISRGLVYVLKAPSYEDVLGVLVLHAGANVLWIENVAVHPQHQRRGYGRRLMQFAEHEARAAGFGELRLYTNELMVENISIYTHLGYVEFDRRLDDGFLRVFMRKELAPS